MLAYPYEDDTEGYLTSNKIASASESSVRLTFDYIIESEAYSDLCIFDYLIVEVFDGANWQELDRLCGLLDSGTKYYDLTPYKNSNLRIRLGWITDDFFSDYLGGAVDNVQVLFPLRSEGSYAFEDGTSMAAPFVSGLAGLLWSYKPELSMREVRNLILNTGDYLPNLYGKVATGRRINVHKALLYFDQTNPIGSIKLNNNATYTTSPLVNLNLSGYDPDGGIQYWSGPHILNTKVEIY